MNDYFNVRSFGATGDGTTNDAAKIQKAIDALPTAGGTVYFPPGTYKIGATLTLPDKSVAIIGAGGVVLDFSGLAADYFEIQNGLTALREYSFENLVIKGNSTVGSELLRLKDTSGFGNASFEYCKFLNIETLINWAEYDTTYTRPSYVTMTNCKDTPPIIATAYLAKTKNSANTYAGNVQLIMTDYVGSELSPHRRKIDLDGDWWLSGKWGQSVLDGSKVNGFTGTGGFFASLTFASTAGTFRNFGNGWDAVDSANGVTLSAGVWTLGLGVCSFAYCAASAQIIVAAPRSTLVLSDFRYAGAGIGIDVQVNDVAIIGGAFFDATTCINVAAGVTGTRVTGCKFAPTGAKKALVEQAGADKTIMAGCVGLGAAAANVTLVGANSLADVTLVNTI